MLSEEVPSKGNPHYRKGYRFELKVRDHFKKEGFEVFRSAGSHSRADLVCISRKDIILVQCRDTDRNPMTQQDRGDFREYCLKLFVRPVIAWNVKGKIKLIDLNNKSNLSS